MPVIGQQYVRELPWRTSVFLAAGVAVTYSLDGRLNPRSIRIGNRTTDAIQFETNLQSQVIAVGYIPPGVSVRNFDAGPVSWIRLTPRQGGQVDLYFTEESLPETSEITSSDPGSLVSFLTSTGDTGTVGVPGFFSTAFTFQDGSGNTLTGMGASQRFRCLGYEINFSWAQSSAAAVTGIVAYQAEIDGIGSTNTIIIGHIDGLARYTNVATNQTGYVTTGWVPLQYPGVLLPGLILLPASSPSVLFTGGVTQVGGTAPDNARIRASALITGVLETVG